MGINTNKIPDKLVVDMVNGKVVPFIGAGFSRSFGYPGWMELLKELKNKIGIKDLDNKDFENEDPLQIAQAFFQFYKEKNRQTTLDDITTNLIFKQEKDNEELRGLVERAINKEVDILLEKNFSKKMLDLVKAKEERKDWPAIEKIKKLKNIPFHYLITTNYDKVIENQIYSDAGYGVLYPGKGIELDWNEHDKTVLKIHGDVETDQGIVFTHEQYYKFMQEYGFYRNKLYTLFSTNTILMIGYGFNDINIHHTYFQFIKDYSENLGHHKKMYMLLTDFDKKEKWKSYFEYYKKYLKSYNVEVIEYTDIPSFIEDLVHAFEEEKYSANINRLLTETGNENPLRPLKSILDGTGLNTTQINERVSLNIIKAMTKFFRNPYILTEQPFDLSIDEEGIDNNLAGHILNAALAIISEYPQIAEKEEYFLFVVVALKYATADDSWNSIYVRLVQVFPVMRQLKYEHEGSDDLKLGEYMYKIFSSSHPDKYLYGYDAGRFLNSNISLFPKIYIKAFLEYVKKLIIENELSNYPSISDYWIQQIREKFQTDDKIIELCEEIDSEVKKYLDIEENFFKLQKHDR
ncbi:SIR2 family NAD-dependent protein deacylase [Niallia taxi]|uniref:SIR2 family NAD-dependent protein deacylase n=1 Tax=Niallia taxi TaxID=2499688 RepID=UPI003F63A9C4